MLPENLKFCAAAYIPFGQGPRVCAGATFAQIESTLIMADVLRHFDFEIVGTDPVTPGGPPHDPA